VVGAGIGDYTGEGVYAWRDFTDAVSYALVYASSGPVAVGRVDLWGTVIEHEGGWRAEYAQPRTIEYVFNRQMDGRGPIGFAKRLMDRRERECMLTQLRQRYAVASSPQDPDAALVLAGVNRAIGDVREAARISTREAP
jgi:hypothetical protein